MLTPMYNDKYNIIYFCADDCILMLMIEIMRMATCMGDHRNNIIL